MEDIYKKAAEIIKNSDALLIGAGAGIGVDSGLPDFRGNEGFWKAYPPIAKLGIKFTEMANPQWFKTKPRLAWAFYGHRYNLYKNTTPHEGFNFLLNIGKKMQNGYFVYTSNVDGHFRKAGFDTDKIYEIHGSINHLQCSENCQSKIWKADFNKFEIDEEKFEAVGDLPQCPDCKSIARPNILMFGDWNWESKRSAEQSAKFSKWIQSLKRKNAKLVIIELGAGVAIPSVRIASEQLVREIDAKLIRINPRNTGIPKNQIIIAEGAYEAMKKITYML